MKTLMRDVYKLSPKDMYRFSEDPHQSNPDGKETQGGLAKFKDYFYVPIKMKGAAKFPEDFIDWDFIDFIIDIHDKGIYTKFQSLNETFTQRFGCNEEVMKKYLDENIFIKGNKPH